MVNKTPGVYIVERNAFPNAVFQVQTAVPAFVGYTERAKNGTNDVTGVPIFISSMAQYQDVFGCGPKTIYRAEFEQNTGVASLSVDAATRFLLYHSMQFYFDNGGGGCWVISVGNYGDAETPTSKQASDFTNALTVLEDETEPAILAAPDAVLLGTVAEWATVANALVAHCSKMKSRVCILDVFNGDTPRNNDAATDLISGTKQGFRHHLTADQPQFAAAYYPWLTTSTADRDLIDFTNIHEESRGDLQDAIKTELISALPPDLPNEVRTDRTAEINALVAPLTAKPEQDTAPKQAELETSAVHTNLMANSRFYKAVIAQMRAATGTLPPSGGIAGVYVRTDNEVGVFKAPANVGLASVIAPTVAISERDQGDLYAPLDGKAINPIRTFPGDGPLVWGARTLDGNSHDWRYINVRRTVIMLEQSIRAAVAAFAFAPNDSSTWSTVKSMIANFLYNQWQAGALAGTTPQDTYEVDVGLGTTMTEQDILDGYMRISVKIAVTRPAEFVVITAHQQMLTA